jgi:hypothetical protein
LTAKPATSAREGTAEPLSVVRQTVSSTDVANASAVLEMHGKMLV